MTVHRTTEATPPAPSESERSGAPSSEITKAFVPTAAGVEGVAGEAIIGTGGKPGSPIRGDAQLDRALVRGLAWTGGMKWTAQIASWVSTIMVARLLTPDDFGLVAMSSVYMGVVALLSEFGVGTSVIVLRDLTHRQIAQISGFSLVIGMVSVLLSFLAAPVLGAFFRAPQLPAVVMVASAGFVITALRVVPQSLLRKELRFRALAVIEGSRAIIQAGAMVALALLGLGYWTLVLGGLLASTCATAMTLAARRHPIAWPRLSAIRKAMTVGLDVLGSRLSWYLYSSADFVVAGRVLGRDALGGYTIAWQMASVPVEKVSALVLQVTPSVFAAVQHETAALRRYLTNLTEGIALLTFPAAVGLAIVADDFVRLILTEKYLAAITPLRILAIYTAIRSISPLLPPVLTAVGRTRAVLHNNLVALVTLPIAFYIGSRWGTAGIAMAWIIVHPLVVFQMWLRVSRAIDLSGPTYLRALWPATSGCLLMLFTVVGLRQVLPPDVPLATRFAAEIAIGAATYAAVLFGLHGERVRAFRGFLHVARRAS